MNVVYTSCAGVDVHKKSVSVCIRKAKGKRVETKTAVFDTFTEDLEKLRDFLRKDRVHRVVMESTGVYWIPVWNVLERATWDFDLVLVNPQHVRALPGRKTDQQDCDRLAELGQYDLLRGSFIPPPETRELRDLTRRRVHLQQDRNRITNRITRLLETVNIKLTSVASDVVGKTGWLILNAIVDGQSEPEELVKLAQAGLKGKRSELMAALKGYISPHFRWLLRQLLEDLSRLDTQLNELDACIRQRMQPYADIIRRLRTIPCVQEITAWTLIAELGTEMSRFPDSAHVASWAGLCPGNQESAGKRQSGKTRKGDRYLRRTLIQNAWAVTRKDNCFLTAVFYRVARQRGKKKAAVAVAHRILTIAYTLLRDGGVYQELGGDYFDRLNPDRTARRLIKRLAAIGYEGIFQVIPTAPVLPTAIPDPSPSRKRGRPPRTTPALKGTTRWSGTVPSTAPKPDRTRDRSGQRVPANSTVPSTAPRPDRASPDLCPRCSQWGIPCIHARNSKSKAAPKRKHLDSTT